MPLLSPDYTEPVTGGDLSAAVVYRLTDASGAVWRSAPRLLVSGLNSTNEHGGGVDGSGLFLVIPTLRHLMEGTTAQIEVYVGDVDLRAFYVLANNPDADYIEFSPNLQRLAPFDPGSILMPTLAAAVASRPVGEVLYTTGGAIPNGPPPQAECMTVWRNRAFACFGNDVWPTQEFATGLGLQWSSYFRVSWHEGTGDILGVCPVDWNYLAVFKRDAIGIISGAGPDGLGHGNYIVQTLTTKAGCTNPRSLVNGADGCYYQDAQTGSLMLLGSNLQSQECAHGADHLSSYQISAAIHVEPQRHIWFCSSAGVIVLDYKHRTETAPLGQVYTWEPQIGYVRGATIAAGAPVVMVTTGTKGGDTAVQVAGQGYDLAVDGVTKYAVLRLVETGDISPLGLQRQFNLSRLLVLGEYQSPQTLKITPYRDFSDTGASEQIDIAAAPFQVAIRPAGFLRAQAVRFRIEDLTYVDPINGPVYGPGSKWVGFALDIQDHGKLAAMPVGRIM
jgi:hypothetical protein